MSDKPISKNKLINILLKKASGFYFDEVQCEYQKTQKQSNLSTKTFKNDNNLSIFDFIDTKSTKNAISDDILKLGNKDFDLEPQQEYVLTKKKVITHYNPPDLQAIKILLELLNESKENDSLNNLSDKELIELKNKLIEEILNEDINTK